MHTVPDLETVGTLTFHQALEQAEVLARQGLPPILHERLSCAVGLVREGKVFQSDDHVWQVSSASKPDIEYRINGHGCSCEDAHYGRAPEGRCKHVLAVLLSRKVLRLMQGPAPTPPQPAIEPPVAPAPSAAPVAPLPEAPASVNCHIMLEGRQVQLTLRDSDETRLLQRLAAVLQRYPTPLAPKPTQGAAQGQGKDQSFCQKHQVAMKQTTKDGRSWWSHKTAEGWCKGR